VGYHTIRVGSMEEALRDQQEKQKEVREAIRFAQKDSAQLLKRVLVQDTEAAGLVDTGHLKNAWQIRESAGGEHSQGPEVANDMPYAGIMLEHVARPFWPPIGPLIDWAERKAGDMGIAPKPFRGRASLTEGQRSKAKSFAFAVQRAIAKRGFRPRYIVKGRLPFAVEALNRALSERLDRIAGKPRR